MWLLSQIVPTPKPIYSANKEINNSSLRDIQSRSPFYNEFVETKTGGRL